MTIMLVTEIKILPTILKSKKEGYIKNLNAEAKSPKATIILYQFLEIIQLARFSFIPV